MECGQVFLLPCYVVPPGMSWWNEHFRRTARGRREQIHAVQSHRKESAGAGSSAGAGLGRVEAEAGRVYTSLVVEMSNNTSRQTQICTNISVYSGAKPQRRVTSATAPRRGYIRGLGALVVHRRTSSGVRLPPRPRQKREWSMALRFESFTEQFWL